VVTVYLDQAKWIDLGRAMHARPGGEAFRDAFDIARHSAKMGLVSFPLSVAHYIETWRAGSPDRRRRLAQTMIELSRARTIARPPDLCNNELDAFLDRVFPGIPTRTPWPVFGWSYGHVAHLTSELTEETVDLELEVAQLATRPAAFNDYGRGHREFGDVYRAGEEELAEGNRDRSEPPEIREGILAASAIMEIYENIEWALDRAGLGRDALGPIGYVRPDLPDHRVHEVLNEVLPIAQGFIAELPTRDAALRLRSMRHQNPETKWESNDLNDIAYLACAVVHCDVIVTEKQWVHELRRSGLLEQHSTEAIGDVRDLAEVLVAAVR
jgi:hypothetical protein